MNLSIRWAILSRDGFRCRYCGARASEAALEVDHVVPRSRGGEDASENLVTACFECNRGKRDRMLPPTQAELAARDALQARLASAIKTIGGIGVPEAQSRLGLGYWTEIFGGHYRLQSDEWWSPAGIPDHRSMRDEAGLPTLMSNINITRDVARFSGDRVAGFYLVSRAWRGLNRARMRAGQAPAQSLDWSADRFRLELCELVERGAREGWL